MWSQATYLTFLSQLYGTPNRVERKELFFHLQHLHMLFWQTAIIPDVVPHLCTLGHPACSCTCRSPNPVSHSLNSLIDSPFSLLHSGCTGLHMALVSLYSASLLQLPVKVCLWNTDLIISFSCIAISFFFSFTGWNLNFPMTCPAPASLSRSI